MLAYEIRVGGPAELYERVVAIDDPAEAARQVAAGVCFRARLAPVVALHVPWAARLEDVALSVAEDGRVHAAPPGLTEGGPTAEARAPDYADMAAGTASFGKARRILTVRFPIRAD